MAPFYYLARNSTRKKGIGVLKHQRGNRKSEAFYIHRRIDRITILLDSFLGCCTGGYRPAVFREDREAANRFHYPHLPPSSLQQTSWLLIYKSGLGQRNTGMVEWIAEERIRLLSAKCNQNNITITNDLSRPNVFIAPLVHLEHHQLINKKRQTLLICMENPWLT